MIFTDDPIRDFEDYEEEKGEPELVCSDCGNPIMEDAYYEIDEENLCEDCMCARYRKYQ